jgi:hypothetical protein
MLYHDKKNKRWQTYYAAIYQEMFDWCHSTFGHPGTDPETGVHSGWDYQAGWLFIYNEKNAIIFTLRWS